MSDEENAPEGALQKAMTKATDRIIESVSSLAGSAYDELGNRVNAFSLDVCKDNLKRMAMGQSIVTARSIAAGKVTMSPMIEAMLKVCPLTTGGGFGCTYVVCAPTDQGKTMAAQFLIHGNHCLRPKRSLKIDATNMTNFAKDFSRLLNCGAAKDSLSQLLCAALNEADTNTTPNASDTGEGRLATAAAKAAATAADFAGKYVCAVGKVVPFSDPIEMQDAEKHKTLTLKTTREDGEPCPILIIDEFYCETEENKEFVKTLIRDAAADGIIVFLMTKDQGWASELIQLNGGTKCKPLPTNVDNVGYTAAKRFVGTAQWNQMFWPVENLRDLIRPYCMKHNLDPNEVVGDHDQITPAEAMKTAFQLQLQAQLGE